MEPTTIVASDLPIVQEARDRLNDAAMAADDRSDATEGTALLRARALLDIAEAFDDYLAHLNEHAAELGAVASLAADAAASAVLALVRLEKDAEAGA